MPADAAGAYNSPMKTFYFAIFATVFSLAALAQTNSEPIRIGAADAQKHFQEVCILTGKVAQVSIREKLVYLNLDKKFPDAPLAGVIFAKMTNQFGDLKRLEGKQVELQGRIEEFKDRLQIVVHSTNQLRVIEREKKN